MSQSQTTQPRLLGDRYEVLESLGEGSAAEVFRVRDRRGGALRAAKVLKPENAARPRILARFEEEYRTLRALHHPHLPEVYDYGWTEEGGRFLVMELVEGEDLDGYFRAHPEDIWGVLYQLSEVLTFVHSHDLLHQDVKPSNVLVKRTTAFGPEMPLVKLLDFGLAYRRHAGMEVELVGTPEYMAPEVVRGDAKLTRAVDYYSLGATLFELLCGRTPFSGSALEVMRAQTEQEPFIEEERLEWTELYPHVRALMSKDPVARLEAFEELRRAVVSRLTGGIDELDRAYGLARIDSLPMIGKDEVWEKLVGWLDGVRQKHEGTLHVMTLVGDRGSGKSYLVGRLLTVCGIQDVTTWRLGAGSDYGRLIEGTPGPVSGQFDRYNAIWRRLKESAGPFILVVDDVASLTEEEAGLLRLMITQTELLPAAAHENPIFVLVAADVDHTYGALDTALANAPAVSIPILAASAYQGIVERFRGELADSTDASVIVSSLADAGEEEFPTQVLARSLLDGALTFSNRRWKLNRPIRSPGRISPLEWDFRRAPLGDLCRSMLVIIALSDGPVPLDWMHSLTGVPRDSLEIELAVLRRRHLVFDCNYGSVASGEKPAIDAPARVREGVRKATSDEDARETHDRFIALLNAIERNVDDELALADHYEARGEARPAHIARIRVLTEFKERGDFASMERLGEAEFRRIDWPGHSNTSEHLKRFYLKRWMESLWARNHYARAYNIMHEVLIETRRKVPMSFLPRYFRGMGDALSPQVALDALRECIGSVRATELLLRLRVEMALLLLSLGVNEQSIAELQAVLRNNNVLSKRDQYRAQIYLAMNFLAVGPFDDASQILDVVTKATFRDECTDEYVLSSTVRAQRLMIGGEPRAALLLCAAGTRVARKYNLDLRRNALYRIAATAYHDLGSLRRAQFYQLQATRLASALGMKEFEAISWGRLAQYEAALGHLGNALRYTEKAMTVIREGSPLVDRAQVHTFHLWLHAWLKTEGVARSLESARRVMKMSENVNEQGRLCLFAGQIAAEEGKIARARNLLSRADVLFKKSGFVDNQVMVTRALMRLEMRDGDETGVRRTHRRLSEVRRAIASHNALMECEIGELEFLFFQRARPGVLQRQIDACETTAERGVDMSLRIEALSLIVRVLARVGRADEARATFDRFISLARYVAANIGPEYQRGLMSRIGFEELADEVRLARRKHVRLGQRRPSLTSDPQ